MSRWGIASRMALGRAESKRHRDGGCEGDAPHGLDRVGVDDLLVRVALLLVVAAMVDEFHLLEDGRLVTRRGHMSEKQGGEADDWLEYLARLSSTKKQHLDLVLGHHAVPLELVLNLVVAWKETE